MALSSTHHRFGHGVGKTSDTGPHHLAETVERGTYTALLAAAGFIIVNLLRIGERRETRLTEHRRH